EDGEGRGPGKVEAEDSGAVATNDEQAELLAARSARAVSGRGEGPRWLYRRAGQTVNRRSFVTHGGPEGQAACRRSRMNNQGLAEHHAAITAPAPTFRRQFGRGRDS